MFFNSYSFWTYSNPWLQCIILNKHLSCICRNCIHRNKKATLQRAMLLCSRTLLHMILLKPTGDKENGLVLIFGPILLNSLNFSPLSRKQDEDAIYRCVKKKKRKDTYVCVWIYVCITYTHTHNIFWYTVRCWAAW